MNMPEPNIPPEIKIEDADAALKGFSVIKAIFAGFAVAPIAGAAALILKTRLDARLPGSEEAARKELLKLEKKIAHEKNPGFLGNLWRDLGTAIVGLYGAIAGAALSTSVTLFGAFGSNVAKVWQEILKSEIRDGTAPPKANSKEKYGARAFINAIDAALPDEVTRSVTVSLERIQQEAVQHMPEFEKAGRLSKISGVAGMLGGAMVAGGLLNTYRAGRIQQLENKKQAIIERFNIEPATSHTQTEAARREAAAVAEPQGRA